MRVVLLADRSFASREHPMLRRVEVGLIDEGWRVVRAWPEGSPGEPTVGLAGVAAYPDSPWRRWGRSTARAIVRRLEETPAFAEQADEEELTVIHGWGEGCWAIALTLAESLDAEVALEVWSRGVLAMIGAFERRSKAVLGQPARGAWLAPDEATRREVERRAKHWPVLAAPWGVHAPPAAPHVEADRPIESVCVLASPREPHSMRDVLIAVARASAGGAWPMLFVEASAMAGRRDLWTLAEGLGLLPRLTLADEMESHRDLILRSDALVNAVGGEHRSLVLDAMAAGMPVVQRADPFLEVASDASISFLVEADGAPAWESAIRALLSDPAAARRRGSAASARVRAGRPVHRQVRAILDAYAVLRGDRPIPLHHPTEKQ